MKIYIETAGQDPVNLGGKGLFTSRLAESLSSGNPFVSGDRHESYDVALHVSRIDPTIKASKHILRLDGVYHNIQQDYAKKNAGIRESIQQADGVIYQSNHAKRLCDVFVGECAVTNRVIPNGSDPTFYRKVPIAMDVRYGYVVMAFAKWRPHKRLLDTIESFLMADVQDSVLLIAGDLTRCGLDRDDINRYFELPNIRYLGRLDQIRLASYVKRADACVHLCWFDACPNSVVESICAGVPTISNNVGGTVELMNMAGLSSMVCHVDEPYDYSPIDLYHPPTIDRRVVADRISQCLRQPVIPDSSMLRIDSISNKYLEFFEVVL